MRTFDCVYYFTGGWLNGRWKKAVPVQNPYSSAPASTPEELYKAIRLQGYPVVRGSSEIGPPDTPPDAVMEDLRRAAERGDADAVRILEEVRR